LEFCGGNPVRLSKAKNESGAGGKAKKAGRKGSFPKLAGSANNHAPNRVGGRGKGNGQNRVGAPKGTGNARVGGKKN